MYIKDVDILYSEDPNDENIVFKVNAQNGKSILFATSKIRENEMGTMLEDLTNDKEGFEKALLHLEKKGFLKQC